MRGIQTITALSFSDLPMLPLKEIIDNATDAAEKRKDPFVKVWFEDDKLIVEDNGHGIPRDKVNQIFDWERFASSKYYDFRPSRGSMGAGMKMVIAYLSALAREYDLPPDEGYLRILSKDYDFTIRNVKQVNEKIVDDRELRDVPFRNGTIVEIKFPLKILGWEDFYDFMYGYMIINPWISFEVNGKEFPRVTKFNVRKQSYLSYYSPREFVDLVLRTSREYPETTLKYFLKSIFRRSVPRVFDPMKKISDLSPREIRALYSMLKSNEKKVFVGFIGRKPIAKRLQQLYGDYERLVYKNEKYNYNSYEVWCAHAEDYPCKFITGINNTLPYIDPIDEYYLYVNSASQVTTEKVLKLTLNEILRRSGINEEEPVLTLFHMFLPKPTYGSYAKTSIKLSYEECKIIGGLIYAGCKWYAGHKGQSRAFKIDKKKLKKCLVDIVMKYYKAGYKLTSRHVYYRAAPLGLYPFNKRGYRAVCDALLEARLEGLLPWDSIVDRSRYWIDPIPKHEKLSDLIDEFNGIIMSKLGIDPWKELGIYMEIWVEKDSIAEFLKQLAYKWLIVIAPSRGYSSWAYVWEGVKRIRDYGYDNNVILYLGDFDPSGLDIENHLKEAIKKFGVNCKVKRVAVKEDDVGKLPSSPLKKTDPRLRKKYRDYEKKYGDKVWEIDAFDPNDLYSRIENEISKMLDVKKWKKIMERNKIIKKQASRMLDEIIERSSYFQYDFMYD